MKTVKIHGTGPPRSPWTRPSDSGCGDTSKAVASGRVPLDPRCRPGKPGSGGSLSTGSPASRTPASKEVNQWRRLNVQSGLRKGQEKRRAVQRVGTEKLSAGTRMGPSQRAVKASNAQTGGKVVARRPKTLSGQNYASSDGQAQPCKSENIKEMIYRS